MLRKIFLLLGVCASFTSADVEFTSPSPGAIIAGGTTLKVEWQESGTGPAISTFQNYQLFLCAGGNDANSFIQLAPIQAQGQFSSGNAASGTIQIGIGGTDTNAYFLKMISVAPGGTVINYSARFSLTGMTGTFPPPVEAGIKGITGTDGPAAQNNVNANAAGNTAAVAGGATVPYTMQDGPTKYAPMQKQPGTKITAKTASMQYPTSAVSTAKTFLPTPKQVTTITVSGTFSISSRENTASPAPMPQDAMQKYLARWKD